MGLQNSKEVALCLRLCRDFGLTPPLTLLPLSASPPPPPSFKFTFLPIFQGFCFLLEAELLRSSVSSGTGAHPHLKTSTSQDLTPVRREERSLEIFGGRRETFYPTCQVGDPITAVGSRRSINTVGTVLIQRHHCIFG